ncbi:transcription factor grauzone-like [Condylostylus longicornis]|uniref:transcription factor grauzone-like n=1 Tax=Condylostylus longicornis TaxID=2530218 RepID=UPI00244E0F08|nr:transcription factor grauzone-like [Condylostylus longicornis]
MICRLCLSKCGTGFDLFNDEGKRKNAAQLIGKYLWFEPKLEDGLSNILCWTCWEIIDNFNQFYIKVEHAQKSEKCLDFKKDASEFGTSKNEENSKEFQYEDKLDNHFGNLDNILTEEDFTDKIDGSANICSSQVTISIKNNKTSKYNEEEILNQNSASAKKINHQIKRCKRNNITVKQKSKKVKQHNQNRETDDKVPIFNKKLSDEDKVIASIIKVYCNVCNLEQKNFSNLKKHCTMEHKQKGFVVCCGKKYFKRFLLVDHIEKHLNPESYKCSSCEKSFTSRWTLRDHIQFIHKNVENNILFKCSQCEKSFTNKNLKLRHELFHIPEEERKFRCISCGKAFPSKATLDCHVRIEHEKRYAGICDICGKSYKSKADLKRHLWERHEGDDKAKLQCKLCNSEFLSRYTYQLHKNNDHRSQNVEQKCSSCDKTFPNLEALRSHVRYTHNAKAKFYCNICGRYFKRQLVLKEHLAVHTGQPLYICPHCPKTFTHSSNMHHHRKRIHPKEFEEARQLQNIKREPWCKKTSLKN